MEIDLRKIRIFSRLSAEALAVLEKCILLKRYEKDAAIIWEADECKTVYFVLSGLVDVYRLARSGREQVLERLDAGESFNLVPVFIQGSLNQANVRAVTDVQILAIEKKDFMELIDCYPELTRAVAAYFAERLVHMVALVERLSLYSVRQRMAEFLVKQAEGNPLDARPRWTQDDIARQLGTVRDVVGRTLRKLEDEGLIRFQRQHILLLDREKLESLANDEE